MYIMNIEKDKTREDVFECLINAFKFIGGIPEEILFDNMASVVDVNTGKIKFLSFYPLLKIWDLR